MLEFHSNLCGASPNGELVGATLKKGNLDPNYPRNTAPIGDQMERKSNVAV